MIVTALRLSREDNDRGDLKLVTAAMKELRYSFEVFGPYRDTPKCTIFGSARIKAGEPATNAPRTSLVRSPIEIGWSSPVPDQESWKRATKEPAPISRSA